MSAYERNKGNRVEREFVNWLKGNGVFAERVPLSGATRYQGRDHDVDVYPWGRKARALRGEVKARKDGAGSTLLRRWLGVRDFLVLHEDYADDLVVVPKQTWLALLKQNGGDAPSTSTQPRPSARPDDATCAKREVTRPKGDDNVDSVGR
jgi:hypothetical protein